jgi:hypothetical protein
MSRSSHRLARVPHALVVVGCALLVLAGCGSAGPVADDLIRTVPEARTALQAAIRSETRLPPIAPEAEAAVAPLVERAQAVVRLRQVFVEEYGPDVVCAGVDLMLSADEPGSLTFEDYAGFLVQQGYGFTSRGRAEAAYAALSRLTQGDLAAMKDIWCLAA